MNVAGVVVAGGSGERFGGPKHELLIAGRPLWTHAADALASAGCAPVIVVGDVDGGVAGGPRRRDSVLNGLRALPDDVTHVVVHDAARPAATSTLTRRVVERLVVGDVDAVIPGIPIDDTVKRVEQGVVSRSIDRNDLVRVQTPQGFVLARLLEAHGRDDNDATDDATLIELMGGTVVVVDGELGNVKITRPEDYELVREAMER